MRSEYGAQAMAIHGALLAARIAGRSRVRIPGCGVPTWSVRVLFSFVFFSPFLDQCAVLRQAFTN